MARVAIEASAAPSRRGAKGKVGAGQAADSLLRRVLPYHNSLPTVFSMETTVTTKGQLTLPAQVRRALGIDTGTVLEVELGEAGCVVLRKRATPGFFDQFAGLKAAGAPFPSGDEARDALRVEDGPPVRIPPVLKSKKGRRR